MDKAKAGGSAGRLLAVVVALCAVTADVSAQSIDVVPVPANGFAGTAGAISADGTTVVGSYIDSSGNYQFAYRWRIGNTPEDLGYIGSPMAGTYASAVNQDGTVVVGTSAGQAFRWTLSGGMTALPILTGGFYSHAYGVSGDGSIVVGQSESTTHTINGGEAFYWTSASGTVAIGTLDTNFNFAATSVAYAISQNGQVIVGQSTSDAYASTGEAFRWQNGIMTGLGTLTGPVSGAFSVARAVNADGTVIVGQTTSPRAGVWAEAFRWTAATNMVGLGVLNAGDDESAALAVSADGSVIVGYSGVSLFFQYTAFRWTQADGMKSIAALLSAAGVNVANWDLQRATGVSANGRIVIGEGVNPAGESVAWVARFAAPPNNDNGNTEDPGSGSTGNDPGGTGLITVSNIAMSFASLGATTQAATGRLDALLQTHWQTVLNHPCDTCAFAFGLGGSVPGDPFANGSLGFKTRLAENWTAGVTLTAQAGKTDSLFGGSVQNFGGAGGVFLARNPDQGLQLAAATAVETLQARIARGYLNGNSPVQSIGETDGVSYGAMVRAGWTFAPAPVLRVTPFVAYTEALARIDGYTETDGPFPARFDTIRQHLKLLRAGGETRYNLSQTSWLTGSVSWVRRFGELSPTISGELLGLFSMSVPGSVLARDAVEVSAGYRFAFSAAGALSLSATVLTPFEGPSTYLGRAIYSHAF